MIRPVLAAILTVALSLPAATAAAQADLRDGAGIAERPMTVDLLRDALARDRAGDGGWTGAVERRKDGPVRRSPQDRDRPGARDARFLPDRCYAAVSSRRGTVAGYGVDCMRAAVARPGDLPPHCLAEIRGRSAPRILYDARCLRSQGWTSRAARR